MDILTPPPPESSPEAHLVHRVFFDKRPKIRLPGDDYLLSDTAREIGKVLADANIYRRGDMVFTLNERHDGLTLMQAETLRTWVEDYVVCFKIKSNGPEAMMQLKKTISQTDAAGILASPQFVSQLREVNRINPVRMPVLRGDGWVELLPMGHDDETKTFTLDCEPFLTVMPHADARTVIDDLLGEFGFADSGRSKSVAVAAMLTVFARQLLPPKSLRPCFIVLGNAEGCGKTLLVMCATIPVLGYVPTGPRPQDEAEWAKTMLSAVLEAKQVLFFDNVKRNIASEALEAFLTAPEYESRILGQSKSFRGINDAVVFITGNGCAVSPDMRRRSLICELFLESERAEDRVFQRNLGVTALLEQRPFILAALWAFIREWDKANRPKPSRSNSSFPEWSAIIGGIVEHASYGCPLETPDIEVDEDGGDMRVLVGVLADGAKLITVDFGRIVEVAQAGGYFERLIPPTGELDMKARAAFAALLKRYDRRIIGNHRFILLGQGRSRKFQIEEVKQ